jgi:hypothetical protein
METKQPGYYRMLLESIEQGAAETISEDKGQVIALAKGIKDYIEKALNSQDPKEVERLLYGARNSMDDVINAIQRGAMAEGTDNPALVALARKAMGPKGISKHDLGGDERAAVMALAQGTATGAERAKAANILAKFYSNDRVSGPSSYAPAKLPGIVSEGAQTTDFPFKKVGSGSYSLTVHLEVEVSYKGDHGDDSEFTAVRVYDDANREIVGPVAEAIADQFAEEHDPGEIGWEMRS